jgi:hypothetical protein
MPSRHRATRLPFGRGLLGNGRGNRRGWPARASACAITLSASISYQRPTRLASSRPATMSRRIAQ